jgi:hypothetical protein
MITGTHQIGFPIIIMRQYPKSWLTAETRMLERVLHVMVLQAPATPSQVISPD